MSKPKTHKAELLLDVKSILGEGPVWDWRRQLLFWVDIEGKKLHRYNSSKKKHAEWSFDEMIGAVAPTEKGQLLLALESGLATFDIKTRQHQWHQALQNSNTNMRCNDGKVGPNGDLWIGTMHKEGLSGAGSFYRISSGFQSSQILSKTTISNGMAWSANNKTFYYIDTETYEVWRFDYEAKTSGISNKTVAFSVPKTYGGPDGMCIDAEGMLWIAHWGGHCVRRWNPKTGKVVEKVEVDAPHVTCCCFGGRNLDRLYISTARTGLTESQLQEFPSSGGLFVCQLNIKGTPINYFGDKE